MSRVITVDQMSPSREAVDETVAVLSFGGVVVMPTDSVYGIGCTAAAGNPGHRRTFQIKLRDPEQTLPWLIADPSDLVRYGREVPAYAVALASGLWPGALTLVVRASDEVPAEYALGGVGGTIALRVPDSAFVRTVARNVGLPLAVTSANTHGSAAAVTGSGIEKRLVDEADLVVDGGPAPVAVASTIVDCTGDAPRVLREGAIPTSRILEVCARA